MSNYHHKVAHAVVTYLDSSGTWQTALRGQTIRVHADDLDRVSDGLEPADDAKSDAKPARNTRSK